MKLLVVGSGGREHALVWKLSQSARVAKIYCAPGNGGIGGIAECIPIASDDVATLRDFAQRIAIDLTVVGPEAPLVAGIVDEFEQVGLRVFGPSGHAAELEGSKIFCKQLLQKYDIPTAPFEVFGETEAAKSYLRRQTVPIVVKADGLAAGKGVFVAGTIEEALEAVDRIMVQKEFGEAGHQIIIEECLTGQEASLMAFVDGREIAPMVPSQDHKRALDNDAGPNTGGMGAYSPVPVVTSEVFDMAVEQILRRTVSAMETEGRTYKGVLYAGLMLTPTGPQVLEYNCRFGDPETQVVLPRLESDIVDVLEACVDGDLASITPDWSDKTALCVVMASGGYPAAYEKGKVIRGLEAAEQLEDVAVFHAGTARRDGHFVTAGGRVLGVTALGDGYGDAIDRAYQAVSLIHFEGAHYRNDIGRKSLP
ncbi:MAG: phosphoribosylamine--glycine ligase [Armatimonadetes bacterium CG2_30_59_28]|nr:phosphoribosylamine--glycine ligase [Armatimonadota bacterium]OIO89539.1 MAG: phosphoribosylamine--glycine ligase [Armatimonadetes bacterium CG2_30_59_28]PIU60302.1 MAG: phosphoribosylamine--glycine ligase [Armatimonadetes bacterium CG07_land_8_20_14_0_80_59_28]PIX44343.1 MAG: phosphoribosylamine--glycine ligase [Armatimonadetes bacterium CG_4_8_14_3_um_filter_58_9]PIY49387.1 MAG: phosphoribosylamine--glycine ligase [Armatimonadetes bacterium CG_4_10_14_3_um_filter_59_10]PJB66576.1 MAG: pho